MAHLKQDNIAGRTIAVSGAYGHTGRFVVSAKSSTRATSPDH